MSARKLSLYQQYLAAAWVVKKIEAADLSVKGVDLKSGSWIDDYSLEKIVESVDQHYSFMFHIAIGLEGYGPEWVEESANTLLQVIPGIQIFRKNGYIYLYGETPGPHHIRWHLGLGTGICERVVVGTKKVMKPDPEFEVPMIEVEEQIIEVRCVDPLSAVVGSVR